MERPRLGPLGWPRRYLILGLPLMATLSPPEFRAVLAHEFAHLRGGHARFGNWIYRLRQTWGQLLAQLEVSPRPGVGLLRAFASWFAPRFNAATYALARRHEFAADRWAARASRERRRRQRLCCVQQWPTRSWAKSSGRRSTPRCVRSPRLRRRPCTRCWTRFNTRRQQPSRRAVCAAASLICLQPKPRAGTRIPRSPSG